MKYILDTNICIYWIKGNQNIERKAVKRASDSISISFITLSELYYGVYKSNKIKENLSALEILKRKLNIIESNAEICETFGILKAELAKQGKMIDDADLFIAACALVNKSTLVTNNEKHFERIKGLKLENWLRTF